GEAVEMDTPSRCTAKTTPASVRKLVTITIFRQGNPHATAPNPTNGIAPPFCVLVKLRFAPRRAREPLSSALLNLKNVESVQRAIVTATNRAALTDEIHVD